MGNLLFISFDDEFDRINYFNALLADRLPRATHPKFILLLAHSSHMTTNTLAARLHTLSVPNEAEKTFFRVVIWLEDHAREGNVTPTLDKGNLNERISFEKVLDHYAYLKERFARPMNNIRLERSALDDGERIHFFY